jgi:hypothetical protein
MIPSTLRYFVPHRRLASMAPAFSTCRPANVLIIGGGYGGLSAAVNLVNLSSGKPQLSCPLPPPELGWAPQTTPQVVLIDQRDGICKHPAMYSSFNIHCLRDTDRNRSLNGRATGTNKL